VSAAMKKLLDANGYMDYREFANGNDACITPLMFTCAILSGIEDWGYTDRWCYESYEKARAALYAWNGEGEPQGWHRHPGTGRRREGGDPNKETIAW
jgi:hypothetical protein